MKSHRWKELKKKFPTVLPGGLWHPKECVSNHHIAIIIPYRDRDEHLRIFLNHMHPFMQKQQLNYGIYVIDQVKKVVVYCKLSYCWIILLVCDTFFHAGKSQFGLQSHLR